MTILGIVALIAVVVLGLLVLRVKSDPMEKDSVRKYLAEAKPADTKSASASQPGTHAIPPPTGLP